MPQTGFGAVSIDVVDGSRGKPSIPDQINRVGDQVRIVGGVLSLKDVMEMRRHGFDDRIPERLQHIDQELPLVPLPEELLLAPRGRNASGVSGLPLRDCLLAAAIVGVDAFLHRRASVDVCRSVLR